MNVITLCNPARGLYALYFLEIKKIGVIDNGMMGFRHDGMIKAKSRAEQLLVSIIWSLVLKTAKLNQNLG